MKPVMYINKEEEQEDFSALLELVKNLLSENPKPPKNITELIGILYVHAGQMQDCINKGQKLRLRGEILIIARNLLAACRFLHIMQLDFEAPYGITPLELEQKKEAA